MLFALAPKPGVRKHSMHTSGSKPRSAILHLQLLEHPDGLVFNPAFKQHIAASSSLAHVLREEAQHAAGELGKIGNARVHDSLAG